MSYLDAFRAAGLPINWRTIAIGWEGPGKLAPVLTLEDVHSFAEAALAASAPTNESELIEILAVSQDESEEVTKLLRRVAAAGGGDPKEELRKWRVVLLKDHMWKFPRDPLYGLLALTEFWEKFEFPDDSPHVVQGRGNTSTPAEYYSEENYRRLLKQHADWIETELRTMKESST